MIFGLIIWTALVVFVTYKVSFELAKARLRDYLLRHVYDMENSKAKTKILETILDM